MDEATQDSQAYFEALKADLVGTPYKLAKREQRHVAECGGD